MGILSLIIISGSFVSVLADSNRIGVGEGVSADGTSEVSSQYLEYPRKQSPSVGSAEVGASVANGCNCVIFRMDDLQDFFVDSVQVAIMDEFTLRDEFLSIGPIFNDFGNEPGKTVEDPAKLGVSSGLFELFNHGWNHTDFTTFNLTEQTNQLQLGQDKAELIFGSITTFFIPPFNEFDNNTLDALNATDFEMISSEGVVDLDPHFVADGTSDIVDSRGLYHLPSDVKFIDFGVVPPARISNSQILDDIDTSISSRGYAVVTLHAQDHAETFPNGTYINAPNATLMNDLRVIIDGVNFKNYPIRTFGQVVAFSGNISIDNVTQVEGTGGTTDFVFDVTRTGVGAISVQYQTADVSATSPADYTAQTLSTLNFGSNETLKTITVPIVTDST
ncbi:MAG TPA: Calx-beta domain-containing protein, partial [Nitrosopumilaceae archaeon]|nr:Calx-beta domain-containing protein [Nitrosopumilaceae archaeon]